MSIDVASLVFEIDSTQAVTARERLEALEKVGARVDASAAKTKSSTERTNAAHREAATQITKLVEKVGAYEKALAGAAGRQGAFERAVVDTATREAAAWAKVEQQLERRNAAYRGDLAAQTLRANEQAALAEARALEQSAAGWAKIEQALERRNAALRGDLAAEQAMQTARAAEQEAEAWRKVEAALERRNAELRGSQALEAMKAEAAAVASLEARIDKLMNSIDPTRAAQARLNAEMQEAAALYKAGAISGSDYAKAVAVLDQRLDEAARGHDAFGRAQGRVAGSSGAVARAGLNMSRQFTDIGVQLAGQTPLYLVLAQQLPQIADGFAQAKMEGAGFGAVMAGIGKATAPLAPLVITVGAVAAGFALLHRELSKGYPDDITDGLNLTAEQLERVEDRTVTMGDTFMATLDVMGKYLSMGPLGDAIDDLNARWNAWLDDITKNTVTEVSNIIGFFIGAYRTIVANWKNFPVVFGDFFAMGVNVALDAVEKLVNGAIVGLNKIFDVMRLAPQWSWLPTIGEVELDGFKAQVTGAAEFTGKALLANIGGAINEVRAGMGRLGNEIAAGAVKRAQDRALEDAGKAAKTSESKGRTGPADRSNEELLRLEQELARSRAEELQAQLALTEDVRARADLEKQLLDIQLDEKRAELAKQAAKIERDIAQKRITEATGELMLLELAALELSAARVASLKAELIEREALRNVIRNEYAIIAGGLQIKIDAWGTERDLAQFAYQRREIDKKILQHQQMLERLKLQEIIDTTAAGTVEHEIAKARLEVLDKIHANQRESAFGRAEDAYNDLARHVGDAVRAFEEQDWKTLVISIVDAFQRLKEEFAKAGNAAGKMSAVAGVASVVGQSVGGKGGGALQGGASAAMAAAAFTANPLIIAGAAVVGGIKGWLDGGKAEKAAKNAEALRRAEEELARVREIAAKRRDLEIRLMEAQGDAAGALAARREDELRAMDASLRALQQQVWAAEDLAEQRQKAVDAAQRAVDEARSRLTDAYNAEAGALQETIDKFASFAESLKRFRDSLYSGPAAMLSPEEQYKATRDAFDRTSTLAAGGDADAIRDLESVSQAYLDASKAYYASSKSYFDDLERVRAAVTATQAYAASQVDVGQQQLNALNASVAGILDVNKSVLSVRDALVAYQGAVEALAAAQAANTPGANDNSAPKGPDWGSYIANNSDVAAEYLRNMASEKGRAYLAQLGIGSAEAFGQWHWNTSGKNEGRTPYADGGIFTNGVVSQPTTFHNSMMGEAGPEAIMPLVRTSDGLGVRATGGGHDAEIVSELKSLRSEVAKLQSTLKAANDQRGMGMQATLEKLDDVAGETARLRKARRPSA